MKNKKNQKRSLYTILIVALLLLVGGMFAYRKFTISDPSISNIQSTPGEKINLDPPTEEEKQAAEDAKNRINNREESIKLSQPIPGTRRSVKPLITSGQQEGQVIEVRSYVPGIFEDGGECTAVFTKNGSQVTKTVAAVKEGNAVYCPLLTAQISEFNEKGLWTAVVNYSSANAAGTSDEYKVEVK